MPASTIRSASRLPTITVPTASSTVPAIRATSATDR
jgi:hypothetical protein